MSTFCVQNDYSTTGVSVSHNRHPADKATTHKIAQSLAAAGIYVWSGHNYAYEGIS